MKSRLQIRLSQAALEELARRSKAAGMTRQAYIEDWLKGLDHEPLAETPTTIAKLEASISRVISEHPPVRFAQRDEGVRRIGPQACLHPASKRVGRKCVACGERLA